MENHRHLPRRRTLKNGQVILSDWTVMDCVVRDMSDDGARLEFGGPVKLPKEFRLALRSTNTVIPVALAWQRGLAAGVHFTGPPTEASGKDL